MSKGSAYERAMLYGISSAPIVDLLALAMCREEKDLTHCQAVAADMFKSLGARGLVTMSQADLEDANGLVGLEAMRTLAAIELGRRVTIQGHEEVVKIGGYEDSYRLFKWLEDEPQENFHVALLTVKNTVITHVKVHTGTLNMSVVSARDIFRHAVRHNAGAMILAHNHPSGDPEPSPEDIEITRKLCRLGEELDIQVHDHIIVGRGKYVSLAQRGLMRG